MTYPPHCNTEQPTVKNEPHSLYAVCSSTAAIFVYMQTSSCSREPDKKQKQITVHCTPLIFEEKTRIIS